MVNDKNYLIGAVELVQNIDFGIWKAGMRSIIILRAFKGLQKFGIEILQ